MPKCAYFLLDRGRFNGNMHMFGGERHNPESASGGSHERVLMDVFQEAAKAAQRHNGDGWFVMSPQEQTRAIYEEMRRIDQERVATTKRPSRRHSGSRAGPSLAA
jgi:hypothetical protein